MSNSKNYQQDLPGWCQTFEEIYVTYVWSVLPSLNLKGLKRDIRPVIRNEYIEVGCLSLNYKSCTGNSGRNCTTYVVLFDQLSSR